MQRKKIWIWACVLGGLALLALLASWKPTSTYSTTEMAPSLDDALKGRESDDTLNITLIPHTHPRPTTGQNLDSTTASTLDREEEITIDIETVTIKYVDLAKEPKKSEKTANPMVVLDDKTLIEDKTLMENMRLKKKLEKLESQQKKQDKAWEDMRKLLLSFLEQEKPNYTPRANLKRKTDYPQPDNNPPATLYRVKPGDTPTYIAEKFNISLACLYIWNTIEDTHLLKIGSFLQTTGDPADCRRFPFPQAKQHPIPGHASRKIQNNTQKKEPLTTAPSPDFAENGVAPTEKVCDWEVISASHKAANVRSIHSGEKSLLLVGVYSPLFGRVEAIDPFLGHVVTASGKINRTQPNQPNDP